MRGLAPGGGMETGEELFRDLCENAHDLIQCVSPDGRFLYVNRAWLSTLRYERSEVAGLTVLDIIHPDSREHCEQILERLRHGQGVVYINADFLAKNQKRVAVEGSASCRREGGRIISTQGIFRDVSERQHARQELDRLFNLSLDLLCVAGTDGYFKQINPAFERVLGYSREELLSRSFLEFVHPEDREETLREVDNLAHGRVVVDFQNRYLARDGGYRWLAWRSTPSPDRELIYAVARDITDHKRTQELMTRQAKELARSNADLERFAYVASHDLRAPLRSIATLAGWIDEKLPEGTTEEVRHNLRRLRDRVRRLDTLTGDLLRYSQAGREPGQIGRVDTTALIEDLCELLLPDEAWHVRAEGLPVFDTDRAAFEQVLRNLLENAVKHHDASAGQVVVSAAEEGDEYVFAVADDGPGIPEQYHERVFQMFQKLDSHDRVEGTGLGLALVQRLVEVHGGRIWLDSGSGRGLTVRFTWPQRIEPDVDGGIDAHDPDR